MINSQNEFDNNINSIKALVGNPTELLIRNFIIGKRTHIDATIIYMNGLVEKDIIDRDILAPLMLHVDEDIKSIPQLEDYICRKYITVSDVKLSTDINNVVLNIKRGKTIICVKGSSNFIVADTTGGEYRKISDPTYETALRGPRDGFVENLEINVSIMQRRIHDKNLVTEKLSLGRRSQTDVVLMYIDDIADKSVLNELRNRLTSIDVDIISTPSVLCQYIEKHTFGVFPQTILTERPDKVQANLMEGKIALLVQGNPFVATFPTLFVEFFQTVEDYYFRTVISSFTRVLRYIAAFIVICFPAIYLSIIKFNPELIPVEFIKTIVRSRKGIVLTPFLSILSMNLMVEFLREGGLRLPSKIGQTLSVVGGIIIGNAALEAKIVSSLTLLVVGATTIATFLIPNYEMSLSLRILSYPTLILSNWLGLLGVAISMFMILAYLCSLDSYGVPYFSIKLGDLKDTFVRAPIWMMNKRPGAIPNNNPVRQSNFRSMFKRRKNGEEK